MKKIIFLCLQLVLWLFVKSQAIALAITDCNVVTMTSDKVLQHQTILIARDKIAQVIPVSQWRNTDNIKTIDGSGKYVIPALADMHIHINQYSNWAFPLLLSMG